MAKLKSNSGGRPPKTGLDWFKHPVNTDKDIDALRAEFGNDAYALVYILREQAYATGDGRLDISRPSRRSLLIRDVGCTAEKFEEMMIEVCHANLFDRDAYAQGIITSKVIRDDCRKVSDTRKGWKTKRRADSKGEVISGDNPLDNLGISPEITSGYLDGKPLDNPTDKTRSDQTRTTLSLVDSGKDGKANSRAGEDAAADELFAELWEAYPRKEGKSAVKPAQRRQLLAIGRDPLLAAIANYRRTTIGKDPKYTLMGSTFFNGRYEDYTGTGPESTTDEPQARLVKVNGAWVREAQNV